LHDILDDKLTGRNDRLTYRTLNRTNYGPLLDLKNSAGAQHALPHARVHTHTHSHTHTIHTNTHTHTHTHTHTDSVNVIHGELRDLKAYLQGAVDQPLRGC